MHPAFHRATVLFTTMRSFDYGRSSMEPVVEDRSVHHALVAKIMQEWVPFNAYLGIRVVRVTEGHTVMHLPFREQFVGDSARPALHGGVLSALADACGGTAVWSTVGPEDRVSTIDLRIDYLRPAPLEELVATADVLRVGNRVGVATIRIAACSEPEQVLVEGKGVYAIRRGEDRGG
ncbi:MAG TPA: PaaI family thioesterase [Polyangiaceae bacterium]|nr:PaaI family thioesterase [Polyangiaceae bacterium]HNZ21482.1 PaaI family thioesterase [Polyangiaceae bacterium]HOD23662.1 PaaI family thioesterase [Polyangiaceae bacterium]HOE50040.1 PaaI family thioesterase [Polyangiaceae bacterium]HOH00803.1 PaaI family thioesterase [Polyangiaceae bacterium]